MELFWRLFNQIFNLLIGATFTITGINILHPNPTYPVNDLISKGIDRIYYNTRFQLYMAPVIDYLNLSFTEYKAAFGVLFILIGFTIITGYRCGYLLGGGLLSIFSLYENKSLLKNPKKILGEVRKESFLLNMFVPVVLLALYFSRLQSACYKGQVECRKRDIAHLESLRKAGNS